MTGSSSRARRDRVLTWLAANTDLLFRRASVVRRRGRDGRYWYALRYADRDGERNVHRSLSLGPDGWLAQAVTVRLDRLRRPSRDCRRALAELREVRRLCRVFRRVLLAGDPAR